MKVINTNIGSYLLTHLCPVCKTEVFNNRRMKKCPKCGTELEYPNEEEILLLLRGEEI